MVSCFLNSSGLQLWQTPVATEANSSVEFQKQHVDFEIRGADNSLNDLLTTAELTNQIPFTIFNKLYFSS